MASLSVWLVRKGRGGKSGGGGGPLTGKGCCLLVPIITLGAGADISFGQGIQYIFLAGLSRESRDAMDLLAWQPAGWISFAINAHVVDSCQFVLT